MSLNYSHCQKGKQASLHLSEELVADLWPLQSLCHCFHGYWTERDMALRRTGLVLVGCCMVHEQADLYRQLVE